MLFGCYVLTLHSTYILHIQLLSLIQKAALSGHGFHMLKYRYLYMCRYVWMCRCVTELVIFWILSGWALSSSSGQSVAWTQLKDLKYNNKIDVTFGEEWGQRKKIVWGRPLQDKMIYMATCFQSKHKQMAHLIGIVFLIKTCLLYE